jgi:hypothetical protein
MSFGHVYNRHRSERKSFRDFGISRISNVLRASAFGTVGTV